MNPNESVLCVKIWRLFHIRESIDSKLISVCLINDYSLIADLYIFVYGRTECATISLECTKVKLLILNNFDCVVSIYPVDFRISKVKSRKFIFYKYIFVLFRKTEE